MARALLPPVIFSALPWSFTIGYILVDMARAILPPVIFSALPWSFTIGYL